MGYTDKHGRPELIAQPFIKKGVADARVVEAGDEGEDQVEQQEPLVGTFIDPDDDTQD